MFYEWAQKKLEENDNWIVMSVETDFNRVTWRAYDLVSNKPLIGNWSGECRSIFTYDDKKGYKDNRHEGGNAPNSNFIQWTWNGDKSFWTSITYQSSIVTFIYNGKTYKCGYKNSGYTYSDYYNRSGNYNKIYLLAKKV